MVFTISVQEQTLWICGHEFSQMHRDFEGLQTKTLQLERFEEAVYKKQ